MKVAISMESPARMGIFLPIARALGQLDDPAIRGVLIRSIAWSIACFAVLHVGAIWIIHRALALHGWLAWAADILGEFAASLLALWLFVPVATAIGMLYFDRIAAAVERRFYPWLPPPEGASLVEQVWDSMVVALRVLALNVLALALAFTGIGLILGWLVAAYAIGRGLFVAVAMRRMPRHMAESLYRRSRGMILLQGAILALGAYVPIVNLFVPVVGVAAMVHVLDMALTAAETSDRRLV
jgi:CysZ protein